LKFSNFFTIYFQNFGVEKWDDAISFVRKIREKILWNILF